MMPRVPGYGDNCVLCTIPRAGYYYRTIKLLLTFHQATGHFSRNEGSSLILFLIYSLSFLITYSTRPPIQSAGPLELSLRLSESLTGKVVTSHTVIWSQSSLRLFIGLILQALKEPHEETSHHREGESRANLMI